MRENPMTDIAAVRALQPITLARKGGVEIKLHALGARIVELWAPDRTGIRADVVLGHDRPEDYLSVGGYIGATCGRYANRIAGGRFRLDDRDVVLDRNEGANQLHGGPHGLDARLWEIGDRSEDHVTFITRSDDGDMGFPGALRVGCTYRLVGDHGLLIEMTATTSAPTVVNLANHAYFNLAGQGSGGVLAHSLRLYADHYTPVDLANIPTGEIRAVSGTAFDFTAPRRIGASMPGPGGFDHNFCLSAPTTTIAGEQLRLAAELADSASGRSLKLWTSEVGLQVYTGGHFDQTQAGKAGAQYGPFAGVALETQKFPDTPNRPHFPSARLDPDQRYRHVVLLDLTPFAD
jgi:aldose 1-epimerase